MKWLTLLTVFAGVVAASDRQTRTMNAAEGNRRRSLRGCGYFQNGGLSCSRSCQDFGHQGKKPEILTG